MRVYDLLRRAWRILPATTRERSRIRRLTQPFAGWFREHNQRLYTSEYYLKDVEKAALRASASIVESVCRDLVPGRVIDVGAGTGALLAGFAVRGVETIGLEYSEAGRALALGKGIDVRKFDVRFDAIADEWGDFDVVCCTEVAEHIPEAFADRLVMILAGLGGHIVFTAATPGQGGVDHVNEQPHEYWISHFGRFGYSLDETLSRRWSLEWQAAGVAVWYWKNLMVFARR